MAKNRAIIFTCVAMIVIAIGTVSVFSSMNGYYYSIAQLRQCENIYNLATIMHTQEMSDKYIDFIIDKNDNYCVIEIDKKQTPLGQKYVKGTWSSKPMYNAVIEDVSLYEQSGLLDFTHLPHFGRQTKEELSYCFAPIGADIVHDNVETVAFTYNGMKYLLCLNLEIK